MAGVPVRVAMTLLQCWHRVPGGTATAAVQLAAALHRRDDVDVIGVAPLAAVVPEAPFAPPVALRRLRLPYPLVYEGWDRVGRPRLDRLVGDAQVLHSTTGLTPPPLTRPRRPMVVTLHDVFPLSAPELFTHRGARLMRRGIERAQRDADLVMCSSRATLEECVAAGFDEDRLRVVPLGVSPPTVTAADRSAVRARYRLEHPYVMWAGTLEPRKNLPTLIDAFRLLDRRDVDLVLVGPTGWSEDLDRHITGVASRVRRLGFVPDADLAALYAEAAVFAFPSLREGFGLPPLEAMAQGAPVVVSSGSACEEVVGDAGLLAPANDVDAWAERLEALLGDEAERNRLAAAARRRAGQFGWDASAEAVAAVYAEVAG